MPRQTSVNREIISGGTKEKKVMTENVELDLFRTVRFENIK
jgi:hypothetical protein